MGIVSKFAKWAAPVIREPDLDSQLDRAMKRKSIREKLREYKGGLESFKDGLKSYISGENKKIIV